MEREIIKRLETIELNRPYTYEAAGAVSELIVQTYDYLASQKVAEYLYHWRINQIATAISYLCTGWLSAAANSVALSLAEDVSQQPSNLKSMASGFAEVSPHIEGAIKELRNPHARDSLLGRYSRKA